MSRSYLFVPANSERLIDRAHERGADVLILDLEDSVPMAEKPQARASIGQAIAKLNHRGCKVLVRLNADLCEMAHDIAAIQGTAVQGLMIPKARSAGQIAWIVDALTMREMQHLDLVALIETPDAVLAAQQIAGAIGIDALAFGPEDFSKSCGHTPTPDALLTPAQQIVWAARSHGKRAIVFPDSIAVVKDEARFAASARRAKEIGSDGILCVHPKQIALVAQAFTATQAEIDTAKRIVAAFDSATAEGKGAILLDGDMIDLPVVDRARAILQP